MGWTVDTMAAQIRGELECDPDAAGGTVPARLENVIVEAGRGLWNGADWRFRWRQGTLTTAAGTATAALPDDFGEMAQRQLRRTGGYWSNDLWFAEDASRWQEYCDQFDLTDTDDRDKPRLATIVQDLDDTTDFTWEVMLAPIPDAIYTYKFWYLTVDPWTNGTITGEAFGDSSMPPMPTAFHEGWHLHALAEAQRAFHKPDAGAWQNTSAQYQEWFVRQEALNNETLTTKGSIMPVPTLAWSVSTLAEQIRSEVDFGVDGVGGRVALRLENIITEAGYSLWNGTDWRFRWEQGTLTTVAGTATAVLPDDYGEMAQRWLRQTGGYWSNGLCFVEDVARWQKHCDTFDITDSDERAKPRIAAIVRDTTDTDAFSWRIILAPTPDDVYTYNYWYLTVDPWTKGRLSGTAFDNTAAPLMPATFYEGWHLYALARVQRVIEKPESNAWRETWAHYREWFVRQQTENDETMTTPGDPIVDGYQDWGHTASAEAMPWP